jgi:putative membrane protein
MPLASQCVEQLEITMKNKKIIGLIVTANLAIGTAAFAQNADQPAGQDAAKAQQQATPPAPPLPDAVNDPAGAPHSEFSKEKFIKEAAKGGMAEVNMGKLATQKGQSPEVKELGQRLVADHSKANDELKEIAQKEGITLSTETDPKMQRMMDHVSGLSGAEFDKAFATHMIQDHKKDIKQFEKAASSDDQAISQFAQKCLPKLKEHLAMAQRIAPQGTAGAQVEEPAGAEPKSDSSAPDYKSPDNKSQDSSQSPDNSGKLETPK